MKKTFAVHWHYGASTHSGWFRVLNEDRSLLRIGISSQGEPYAVAAMADGMGGTGDGVLASDAAITYVKEWLERELAGLLEKQAASKQIEGSIDRLFYQINAGLLQLGRDTGKRSGTTLTILLLFNETYFIGHVGDCRIYRFDYRRSKLRQITNDQTWTAEEVRKGRISKQVARMHAKRHVLLQSLGLHIQPKWVKRMGFYDSNCLFLLCSDGLYDRLTEEIMAGILQEGTRAGLDLQQISDKLVESALSEGAGDNISAVTLRPLHNAFSAEQRAWHRLKHAASILPRSWGR